MGIVPHVHPERHLLRRYRVAFRHYYSIFSWVLFCAGKKTKIKDKKGWMDGWSSKMRHRREIVSFFNRSINQRVFFVCVRFVCVCFGLCRFLVRVLYIEKKESVPPENVGTRWDVTTFHKASSFYASSSSSSSSFLRFWKFPPRFSRRLRRSRRRRGAKRPRRRLERVLAPFREVRRRF